MQVSLNPFDCYPLGGRSMANPRFFVLNEFNGEQHGPYTVVELCEMIEKRKLKKKTLVAKEGKAEWNEAGILLAKLFEKVAQKKQAAKDQARQEKEERLSERRRVRDDSQPSDPPPIENEPTSTPTIVETPTVAPQIETATPVKRPSLLGRLLRGPKETKYWGFKIASILVNVLIVISMIGSVGASLFILSTPIWMLFGTEKLIESRSYLLITISSILLAATYLAFGVFIVCWYLFLRNVIDWMIDIESHLRRLSDRRPAETE